MEIPQIEKMIGQWNLREYQGCFFLMLAILVDEELAGTVSLLEQNGDTVSLGIEVIPSMRGRGVGTAAGSMALENAGRLGYHTAISQVRKDNEASIRLHQKLRFTQAEEAVNRRGIPVLWYRKRLMQNK